MVKKCKFPGEQDKCCQYEAHDLKNGLSGNVLDLTCIHWREDILDPEDGEICDAPEPQKVQK